MSTILVTFEMVIRLPMLLKGDVRGKKQEQRQAFLNCHLRFTLPPQTWKTPFPLFYKPSNLLAFHTRVLYIHQEV